MKSDLPVRLFVVERGAAMPEASVPLRGEGQELSVFLLADTDSPSELALRALRHIAAIERSGQRIASAVIAAGTDSGGKALAARCLMARALLAHQVGVGRGELVLISGGEGDRQSQHELLALVGALTGELGATNVSIRVVIDAPDSQVSRDAPRPLAVARPPEALSCCPARCLAVGLN